MKKLFLLTSIFVSLPISAMEVPRRNHLIQNRPVTPERYASNNSVRVIEIPPIAATPIITFCGSNGQNISTSYPRVLAPFYILEIKSLKDMCASFIKKNKDKFSQESLNNLPEEVKTEIGIEKKETDLDCAICFDKLEKDRPKQKCGHDQFHRDCIEQWKKIKSNQKTCPICRREI